jgi:glycosyltransferase involved in cell wall biosynthesis
MNICFASYEGVPQTKGGPYVKILETKKYLEKNGHKVSLFNMWDDHDKLDQYDIINLFGANFAVYGLARNLKDREINFVVEPIFYSNHSFNYLKRINKIDNYLRKYFRGVWLDYGIIRDICTWSKLILPNTSEEAKIISKGFGIPVEKFEVVPNGVSDRFLSGDPNLFKEKYGVEKFILYVGHLGSLRKNGSRLIKALSSINHPAVIIGDILKTAEGERIKIEAAKNKNIILIGSLENQSEMLASAYAACDTFVLPSQFETPGISALEAALAGAKIVITPHGGTKEYFKNMAEYVEPDSSEAIKAGIEKSLNKSKDNNLQKFIKENFLWENVAQKTLRAYQRISPIK